MAEIERDGEVYPVRMALLVLSSDERRRAMRLLDRGIVMTRADLPRDLRVEAVSCEAFALGLDGPALVARVRERIASDWDGVLDLERILARQIYERMHDGPTTRNVAGFRSEHLKVIDREIAAGSDALEVACALWRTQRRLAQRTARDSAFRSRMPALHLVQKRIPPEVRLSRLVNPSRPYEPVFVHDGRAYPVSAAWVVAPQQDVRAYVDEVGTWMAADWPEAYVLCDDPADRIPGYALDRRNVQVAAEAFVRGYLVEEAARFIFEQRMREEEMVA